jgi:hypothetical protein
MTEIKDPDLKAGIDYLLATEDEMLVELGKNIENKGECPTEEELTQILAFLLVFSVGCRELKLDWIADKFSKRADKFSIALSRFGMYSGQLRNPLKNNQKEPLKYNRILSRATAIAAYKVAGSVNTYG